MSELTTDRFGAGPVPAGRPAGGRLGRALRAVRVFGAAAFDVIIMGRGEAPPREPAVVRT
ncbi:hypothetical protein RM844_17705 [Streptomyces sp. DSM 44915]|uniref:Uncharacterized protein n=1 Tax=Streptomyces chisholmiae TaxID=3075540 RepID=A0ABU2JT04_9ACTN|nr:hypothetical protein [Streptomyces sp. DSM 44915]MDT0268121.1 hypothetical protein [Streptomyces sp. DSM 44915]